MKDPKYLRDFAADLVTAPEMVRRNEIFAGMDRLDALEWEIPKAAKNIPGLHKMVRPDPAENIRIATNAIAGSTLSVRIDPLPGNDRPGNLAVANMREQFVKWWVDKLNFRDEGSVLAKIARSAYLKDMIAFRTDHVDYVYRATKRAQGVDEMRRGEYLQQGGPFGWTVYDPACVYPLFSGLGLERIVVMEVKLAAQVVDYYGAAAKKLRAKLDMNKGKDGKWQFKYVTEVYYQDREQVYCYCIPSEVNATQLPNDSEPIEIINEKNEKGFINWVVKVNKTTDKHDSIRPMLYNTWKSGWAESQNLVETLAMTTFIQNAGKPDWIEEGVGGDAHTEVDYTHLVGGVLRPPPGHTIKETNPAVMDQALVNQSERLGNWQARTGASRALAGATTNETFAGQMTDVRIGAATVETGRQLIHAALAAGGLQCFQWVKYLGEKMYMPAPKTEYGLYELDPATLDIGSLNLSVTLREGKPGMNIQVNNAMAIAKSSGVSNKTALETMGYEDPEAEIDQSMRELLQRARVENQIKIESARADAEAQRIMAMAQMELQQMMQAQQQEQQMMQAPPPAAPTNEIYSDAQPMQALNPTMLPDLGQGMDANSGGVPPALLNPNMTRELQTGLDANGQPI